MLLFKGDGDASVLIPIMGLCYVGVIFVARSVTQATVPLLIRRMAHTCACDSVHKP
jgi:hypothetical protein